MDGPFLLILYQDEVGSHTLVNQPNIPPGRAFTVRVASVDSMPALVQLLIAR